MIFQKLELRPVGKTIIQKIHESLTDKGED